MVVTAGLDVGGAHLKVALVEDGRVKGVDQFLCPLWAGLANLESALAEANPLLRRAHRFAVTMTGELSDVFPDRVTGVATLVERMEKQFGAATRFWMSDRMGCGAFGTADEARARPAGVGSMNFLASASVVADRYRDGLLVDLGSTTADIIPVRGGRPVPRGLTDGDRQATGELVYTGYTRTAVMAVASRAPFRGQWVTLAREHLATMADVRRLLGALPEGVDLHATADGQGKSVGESRVRFARLLGRDASEGTDAEWTLAAAYVDEEQIRSLTDGALLVASAAGLTPGMTAVVAGIGSEAAARAAARLGLRVETFADAVGATGETERMTIACAPAVAVALLADRETFSRTAG